MGWSGGVSIYGVECRGIFLDHTVKQILRSSRLIVTDNKPSGHMTSKDVITTSM